MLMIKTGSTKNVLPLKKQKVPDERRGKTITYTLRTKANSKMG
jgi:hypothetical protein